MLARIICTMALGSMALASEKPEGKAPTLAACYPYGDPNAAVVDAKGERLFCGEGASVALFDIRNLGQREPKLVRRFAVDASIIDLLCIGDALFIAGGRFGLLRLDIASGNVQKIDRVEGTFCMDLAATEFGLFAVYGARGKSECRVYDPTSGEVIGLAQLSSGTAFAVAADEHERNTAYVALGLGGACRIVFDDEEPRIERAPGCAGLPVPDGFQLDRGMLRDVALAENWVHFAADAAGLVSLRRDLAWNDELAVEQQPVTVDGKPTYVCRVASTGDRIALGTNRAPVAAVDGAPFNAFGWMSSELFVGGVPPSSYPPGTCEALVMLRRTETELEELYIKRSAGGWRSLRLERDHIVEQHIGGGCVLRHITDGTELFRRRPPGTSAVDGLVSLNDPGLVLFGVDPAGSQPEGFLYWDGGRRITPAGSLDPGTKKRAAPEPRSRPETLEPGLIPSAQWLDEEGVEWVLTGTDSSWQLMRIHDGRGDGQRGRGESWPLIPPADAGGPGRTYFLSGKDGDLLLLTRANSEHGLLAASAEELCAAARTQPSGASLELRPRAVVRTHRTTDTWGAHTWRSAFFTHAGKRHAVVAEGYETDPESTLQTHAMFSVYVVEKALQGKLPRIARGHAPKPGGHALAVAVGEDSATGIRRLYVADFGHGVWVFDLCDPEQPQLVGDFELEVSPFDGRRDGVMDLVLDEGPGGPRAWLAAGRSGVLLLDCSKAAPTLLSTIETPGWASGLHLDLRGDDWTLFVGDQKAGLRIYR